VDVEGPSVIIQVKHRRILSLCALEALAVEAAAVGRTRGKLGVLVVKRRAGRGRPTPRLVVMTDHAWEECGRSAGRARPVFDSTVAVRGPRG